MKLVALLALALLCQLPASFGCSCVTRPIEDRIKTTHVIFTGVCLSVTPHKDTGLNEFVFQVESAWLNRPAQRITVFSTQSTCGYDFTPTKRYLVWTRLQEPRPGPVKSAPTLHTSLCSHNQLIEADEAKQDLATLGAPLVKYPAHK